MNIVTIDFETYWTKEHSLSKMSPIEYVMHPETEIISCSIKVNNYPTDVWFGEDAVRKAFASIENTLADSILIAHNNQGFDALIAAWRFHLKPKMWGCTLAMATPLHAITVGGSLSKLVDYYANELQTMGIAAKKDNAILLNTQGKHLADFTQEELDAMRVYNRNDTDQCYGLFRLMLKDTPKRELWVIDSNIRMTVEPKFVLNTPMLEAALKRERAKKRQSLLNLAGLLGVDATDETTVADNVREILQSATKFSALLTERGVPVPTKPSPKDPNKEIPALAKTDDAFMELLEDEDEVVATAAAARLESKSTQLETRLEAFLHAGRWCGGLLPVPTKYYGAHTGRDSGVWYNMLNLPRIGWNKDGTPKPSLKNALRMSLMAPKGHVVIVADKSGIEMRLNHHLWKVKYSTALWREDPTADIYRTTAAKYYDKAEEDVTPDERQFGKVLQLACGFGIGGPKFQRTAWTMGRLRVSLAASEMGVQGWRMLHREISDFRSGGWGYCTAALEHIMAGQRMQLDPWGLLHTTPEGIRFDVDGRMIRYPNLRSQANKDSGRAEMVYGDGRHTKYIYGGKADENVIQFLGRTILMDDQQAFWRETGLLPALRVYDELVYVVPENEAQDLLNLLLDIMRTPPKWWPELSVHAEGDMAVSYGLAK